MLTTARLAPKVCIPGRHANRPGASPHYLRSTRPTPIAGVQCPVGTTISTLVLLEGQWRLSSTSLDIFFCGKEDSGKNGEACIGGSDPGENGNGYCRKGHSGPLCSTCENDHYFDQGTCNGCPSGSSIVGTIGATLAILLVLAGLVWALYYFAKAYGRLRRPARWALGQIAAISPIAKCKITFAFLQFCLLLPFVYQVHATTLRATPITHASVPFGPLPVA